MKGAGVQTMTSTRHGFHYEQWIVNPVNLTEARDEGVKRALACDPSVEARKSLNEIVKDWEGIVGVGNEVEGFPGVEAAVAEALVEEVTEHVEVTGTASIIDELVVVSGGGMVREGLSARVLGGETVDCGGNGEDREGIKGFVREFPEKGHCILLRESEWS